jgi:hypothetical protein
MIWKVTAAASGLMLVGTWLAQYAPLGPPSQRPASPSAAHTETAAADIQREADRLHSRMQQVTAYQQPSRNPFRFSERPVRQPAAAREPVMTVEDLAPSLEPQRPTLRMMLAGIAEDKVGEEIVRTAIISTPDDVHLVKIGETIGDAFKVSKIEATSVELVRLDNGSTVHLSLRP